LVYTSARKKTVTRRFCVRNPRIDVVYKRNRQAKARGNARHIARLSHHHIFEFANSKNSDGIGIFSASPIGGQTVRRDDFQSVSPPSHRALQPSQQVSACCEKFCAKIPALWCRQAEIDQNRANRVSVIRDNGRRDAVVRVHDVTTKSRSRCGKRRRRGASARGAMSRSSTAR